MTEIEIELTRAYLQLANQDPVAALIRSVRDLARTRMPVSVSDAEFRSPPPTWNRLDVDTASEPFSGPLLAEAA